MNASNNIAHQHFKTYVLLILTNLVWGSTWVVAKLLTAQVPPLTASAARFIMATLALAVLVRLYEGRIPALPHTDRRVVLGMGLTGIFLYSLCFLIGLKFTSAGRGALIIALNPAVIALAAWLVYKEVMTPIKGLGIALALIGCVWVVGNGHPMKLLQGEVGWGELLIAGCVLAWAVYTFISRRASGTVSPVVMNFYACLVGGVLLSVAALFESPWHIIPQMAWQSWAQLAYLAFFATALSYTWYLSAVKTLGAGRTALFTNLTPLSGVLMGAWFIGERLPWAVLAGGIVTILGVGLTIWADYRYKQLH